MYGGMSYYRPQGARSWAIIHRLCWLGGRINKHMSKHVVEIAVKAFYEVGKVIKNSRVLIMGFVTYKENVARRLRRQ